MATLYLVRHGTADPDEPGLPDEERLLTSPGEEEARLVGKFLGRRVGKPDAVFSSPIRRANKTAAIVAEVCGCPPPVVLEPLLPYADPHDLIPTIESVAQASTVNVLVGHQPHLGRTIGLLLGCDPARFEVVPATVVELDVIRVNPGDAALEARLRSFVTPGLLRLGLVE